MLDVTIGVLFAVGGITATAFGGLLLYGLRHGPGDKGIVQKLCGS